MKIQVRLLVAPKDKKVKMDEMGKMDEMELHHVLETTVTGG